MEQSLLVFITVAEKKNFTRAAEQLCMTQPAVSQYIHALERNLKTPLLERSNKFVRLNPAGQIVYHYAKEMRALDERMHGLVEDLLHTAEGPLTVGASYTFGEYILPYVISSLHQKYPRIKPAIKIGNTREILSAAAARLIDIGIIEGAAAQDGIRTIPLTTDQMYIVCSPSHPLAQTPTAQIDLNRETWIIREKGSGTREATEKMFAQQQLQPTEIMEFGSTQIIKESVEAGLGIALLSFWAIRKEIEARRLYRVSVPFLPFLRTFSIIIPDSCFRTKATDLFLQELQQHPILNRPASPSQPMTKATVLTPRSPVHKPAK